MNEGRQFRVLARSAQQALRSSGLQPALGERLVRLAVVAFDRVEEAGGDKGVLEDCRLELTSLIEEFERVCAVQYDDGGRRCVR